jgi:5-methylthioadenosine/S-adenosylhomocysteine deaminase
MIKTLIKDCIVITVDEQRHVFWHGAIAINDGKILEAGPSEALESKYKAEEVIDGRGFIAMPGLTNLHFHLPQVLMRGVYDDVDGAMIKLKNYTWPIQGHYDEFDALTSTKLGVLEMLKSGTTAFLSTGLHPRYNIDAIAQFLVDSGIRAGISKYVMDLNTYALEDSALHPGMWETGEESKTQTLEMIDKWHGAGEGRISAWISPRSVGGCSLELMKWVSRTARERKVGITAHWSEVQNNVDYTLSEYGKRPMYFAQDLGFLGPDVVLAHGIYVDDEEIELLAETETTIAHCPRCNSKLAMGVAPVPKMLRAGVNVTLANDGMGVNNTADIFREMQSMIFMHRINQSDPDFPTAADALEMATIHGAKGLMLEDKIGSLETGKSADLILIDYQKPHMLPLHDPVSAVVWAATGQDVDSVMIGGEFVMRHRQVLTMNEAEILRDAEGIKDKIIEQSGVSVLRSWKIH